MNDVAAGDLDAVNQDHGPSDAARLRRQVDALQARVQALDCSAREACDVHQHLSVQETLLRTVLDESPDFIVLKDHQGNFLLCNQPVADFHGTTPQAMVGRHEGHFSATREQADQIRADVLEIMARGRTETVIEESIDARTGRKRWFKSIKKPFVGDDGLPRILVIAHDITDVRRAQEQVQQSERRLSHVLGATGEGVWDWDLRSNALQHNQRWYELLGLQPTQLTGTIADFEACLLPEDYAAVTDAMQQCLDGHGPYRHEHRMRRGDGSVIWVLDRGDVVERDGEGRPLRMVGSLCDVTERKTAEELTQRLAFYDALTGLPNRRLMFDRLQHAIALGRRNAQFGALMFLDLDHFKELNDTLGHASGDALLLQVAQRLQATLRGNDTAARMGGDEFVVIAEDLGHEPLKAATAAEALGAKLLKALSRPYALDGALHLTSCSLGVALFGYPDDTADEMLKRADFAMYQAKDAGRNTQRFFDPVMQETVLARAALAAQLRLGLERGELDVYLQPVVDAQGRRVGAEALVRWRHPQRGLVPPAEFIPLAEQNGLIVAVGQQVLETACRQLVAWQADAATRGLTLSVNVSARQFHQGDFVRQVLDTLQRTGADANLLKLELTESLLLGDVDEVVRKMRTLRARGVRFSIDDFGTGYSSLAYLKQLPLDEIKIDRSFIEDVLGDANDASIVQTILLLARSLSLKVVAEGVENALQQDFLVRHGCPYFQGFLWGRPVPASQWAPQAA
ncbi:putative bifunctional diguanylate cyclase/phosphodiesterase [Azohydromonas lata]|uniref:EAL domain-containing protein n=1 Tax=Azohydromonas lata TaxID=45677 RepID=A0ABU5IS37_9BURK|nr:GGDEF and EAL domain-containing protein [Azohydromonas lata]MDZ5461706.1 EAL domain-containing protein [Azohydromonas lata]